MLCLAVSAGQTVLSLRACQCTNRMQPSERTVGSQRLKSPCPGQFYSPMACLKTSLGCAPSWAHAAHPCGPLDMGTLSCDSTRLATHGQVRGMEAAQPISAPACSGHVNLAALCSDPALLSVRRWMLCSGISWHPTGSPASLGWAFLVCCWTTSGPATSQVRAVTPLPGAYHMSG